MHWPDLRWGLPFGTKAKLWSSGAAIQVKPVGTNVWPMYWAKILLPPPSTLISGRGLFMFADAPVYRMQRALEQTNSLRMSMGVLCVTKSSAMVPEVPMKMCCMVNANPCTCCICKWTRLEWMSMSIPPKLKFDFATAVKFTRPCDTPLKVHWPYLGRNCFLANRVRQPALPIQTLDPNSNSNPVHLHRPSIPIGHSAVWHLMLSAEQKILLRHWPN